MARVVPNVTRRRSGQSMVEFALISPLLILILFLTVDFARLVYTYAAVSWATRQAARVVSLEPQNTSDCQALQIAEQTAQGFQLSADPNSRAGNSDPNAPAAPYAPTPVPPAGRGYIYIWPAVAGADPDNNCNGSTRGASGTIQDVAVQVKYTYLPLMPIISSFVPSFTITTISVVHVEY